MKNLFIILFTVLSIAGIRPARAQYIYNREGNQLAGVDYSDVEGSPWLTDSWSPGTVKLYGGKTFKDSIMLRYNVATDDLYFRYIENEVLKFKEPVSEFSITYFENKTLVTKVFRSGYKDISNTTTQSFFQVISGGRVQLIKKLTKSITTSKSYGQANGTRSFQNTSLYYLVTAGKAVPVKNDKENLLSALTDHREQIKGYADAGKLNFKSDVDLAKLISYYNTL